MVKMLNLDPIRKSVMNVIAISRSDRATARPSNQMIISVRRPRVGDGATYTRSGSGSLLLHDTPLPLGQRAATIKLII